jgi:hypothetical protein
VIVQSQTWRKTDFLKIGSGWLPDFKFIVDTYGFPVFYRRGKLEYRRNQLEGLLYAVHSDEKGNESN